MNLIQRISDEQSLISYEQSVINEIWRLTREIEQAQQIGHTHNADNLLCELEVKLDELCQLNKRKR